MTKSGSYKITHDNLSFGYLYLSPSGYYVWCPPNFKGKFISHEILSIINEKILYLREYYKEEIGEYLKKIETSDIKNHFEDLNFKIMYNPTKTLHEL